MAGNGAANTINLGVKHPILVGVLSTIQRSKLPLAPLKKVGHSEQHLPNRSRAREDNENEIWAEYERLRMEKMCKVCYETDADMLLLPCSHLCSCKSCTDQVENSNCPVCRKYIKAVVRVYRA